MYLKTEDNKHSKQTVFQQNVKRINFDPKLTCGDLRDQCNLTHVYPQVKLLTD